MSADEEDLCRNCGAYVDAMGCDTAITRFRHHPVTRVNEEWTWCCEEWTWCCEECLAEWAIKNAPTASDRTT